MMKNEKILSIILLVYFITNYIGKTGADQDYKENLDIGLIERKNLVPLLHTFAKDFLHVNYMFWVHQEPYFSEDVIPCLSN